MPLSPSRFRLLLVVLCALVVGVHAAAGPVWGSDEKPKKKSGHSEEKSGSKKKGHDTKYERVEKPKVIGADTRFGNKQFDNDAGQAGKVDAVLVLDASRSMLRTDPNRLRDQAAKLFLRFLGEGDRVAILQFDREVKPVIPMTEVNQGSLANLDKAISDVPMEGGFTDLEAPLEEAMKVLVQDGRSDATKAVVLLSDGKMDPHPSRGTPQELTQKVLETLLPQYHEKNIKLYTVAMSGESDRQLLADFAEKASGLSWFAPDANTVHKKFSELFLTLKRPQVVPLEGEGFEVDSSVQEATFYINRKDSTQAVTLVDPRGTEINSSNIPAGVKWYSGELFDVVTIARPFPGRWTVKGLESLEGFATLLSDINLQVRWPNQSTFKIGDNLAVYARLTNQGEEVTKAGLGDITFYTYKIISSSTGATWLTGALNDKGEDGDAKAGDGIFSTTLKLDKDGDYQALFAVTSPTFTRQQRFSFAISAGLVNLKVVPADEFAGTHEMVQAVLTKEASDFKSLKVQLVAKKEGAENPIGITLKPDKENPDTYTVPTEKLEPGEYEIYVRAAGTDEKKKSISASSETMKYSVHGKPGTEHEHVDGEPIEELPEGEEGEHEAEPSDTAGLVVGLIATLLALGWLGGLWFWGMKKVSGNKLQIVERPAYVPPPELLQRVEQLKAGVSDARRRATHQDREVFKSVADIFQGEPADEPPPPEETPEAAAEDAPEGA